MKYLLIPILLFRFAVCNGQSSNVVDTTKMPNGKEAVVRLHFRNFSLNTDLAQYIITQPNLSVEYRIDNISVGLFLGLILPDPNYSINPFINGQYLSPGAVYSGLAIKSYIKLYQARHSSQYWCGQLVCKPEGFNNVNFYDQPYDPAEIYYTMNENTVVLGLDIMHGHEINENHIFHLDFFYGLGYHCRIRDYSITSLWGTTAIPDNGEVLQIGNYHKLDIYITPVIGLKMGFNSSDKY